MILIKIVRTLPSKLRGDTCLTLVVSDNLFSLTQEKLKTRILGNVSQTSVVWQIRAVRFKRT
jgi:hypothetical protein